jgi:amino acid transporter
MLYNTIQALGEMAVVFPVAGSFSAYSTRFLDPSWGFAMGWVREYLPLGTQDILMMAELRDAMVGGSPTGDYCCFHYYQLLG